ncbi:chaperone protein ClpB1-like [Panicum miliaceum]|uniref:Chaperone protein ClpB1-like n=1 Tax=Panicum miliaceum TaxID=4540 RepID=A0A3L6RQN0_PANMI|nr:chaperone protein ClpB1-like [Panicum miliaceum]
MPPKGSNGGSKKPAPAPLPTMLSSFGRNLTVAAESADPVVCREDEIDRVVCILSRKSKNSAVLVGAPGVGKTAIAEGLAQRIARGEVSGVLAGARVVELSVAAMISGTTFRGTFEERVTGVLAEAEAAGPGKVVLFVDEIHMLLGAGRVAGSCMDASNMLKPALARGRVRCLGATTHDEYQRYFVRDAAFERRFQKVHVAEPSEVDTVAILRRLKAAYEEHHGMEIQDEALVAAARLSGRYIPARHYPDKAIDLVDEACATARLLMDRRKKQGASSSGQPLLVPKDENVVGPDHIAQIVSKWTGIPVASLGQDERKRLLELPKRLHKRVVDQDEAVDVVAEAVVRSRSGLGNPDQPSGSFLFLGPTGVGKTELAKALAEQLFGNEKLLVRIDMSEYVSSNSVTRLIGSAPGSLGYEKGGQLTEMVRQRPYSVVLFDEVEKANSTVTNLFLQILDDGRLTDGQGRTRHFRPELINRLGEVVLFHQLSGEQLRKIARMQLKGLAARLADKGVGLDVTDAAIDVVLSRSSDQVQMYGARPIKRFLQKNIMTRISKMVVQEEVDDDCYVSVDADGEKKELVFTVENPEPGSEVTQAASSKNETPSSSSIKKRKRRPPAKHLVVIEDDDE